MASTRSWWGLAIPTWCNADPSLVPVPGFAAAVTPRPSTPPVPSATRELTGERLAAYLIGVGLTTPREIVAGLWSARPVPGRHRNFDVDCGPLDGLFVKQADSGRVGASGSRGEARLYQWVAEQPACAAVRPLMPQMLFRDDALGVIVLRRIPGAQTFREQIGAAGTLPLPSASGLGRALAECHRMPVIPTGEGQHAQVPGGARGPRPWTLSLAAGRALSEPNEQGGTEFRAQLATDRSLMTRLRALDAAWTCDCTMHGDLRWSNCLVRSDPPQLVLIDWEFSGPGDRAWDIGSVLQGFLLNAFLTPIDALTSTAHLTVGARDFQRHWPAARSFWQAYRRHLGPTSGTDALLLRRALEFAGVALIQSAHELSREAGRLSPLAPPLLAVARRLVERPLPSGRELLGLASS